MSANTAIYDRTTAWELVEYFGRLYGMTEERLRERMEFVFTTLQMNDFRDVLGAKMSTGMKQKVSIGRALVHDPPVLIFRRTNHRTGCVGIASSVEKYRDASRDEKVYFVTRHHVAKSSDYATVWRLYAGEKLPHVERWRNYESGTGRMI
jgi:sodium transport system ATP-binding protein